MDLMEFGRLMDDQHERLRRYSLTAREAEDIFVGQRGLCGYCDAVLPADFHIDHDHWTMGVRGFLCRACNTHWVGPHDLDSATRLVEYLNRPQWGLPAHRLFGVPC